MIEREQRLTETVVRERAMSPHTSPASAAPKFHCPLRAEVHQTFPGVCPTCGMDRAADSARFATLRRLLSRPGPMLQKPRPPVVTGVAMAITAARMTR
jgi:hypothetical protein